MVTQDMGNLIPPGVFWAMDNGCFNHAGDFDLERWRKALERYRSYAGDRLLFVVAPDVPFDADGTIARFEQYRDELRHLGAPVAFVSQDGMGTEDIPNDADALFVGGSTAWKTSEESAELVRAAKRRGMWVHMGRVNSLRRLYVAKSMGCDSADGTFLKFGPDVNWPRMQRWFAEMERQPVMPL